MAKGLGKYFKRKLPKKPVRQVGSCSNPPAVGEWRSRHPLFTWLWGRREGYEVVKAVDHVDVSVEWGEVYGLLGPNGAGKTTLILLLATLLSPDEGTAFVNGYDIRKEDYKVRMSLGGAPILRVMAENWMLTPRQELRIYAGLYGIPSSVANERIARLLEEMDLTRCADDENRKLSSGMRMKLRLVKALLPNAPILLFDEPTVSLDVDSAKRFRRMLKRMAHEEGKAVLLATHNMEEAEETCDKVIVMKDGRVLTVDTPERLKKVIPKGNVLEVSFEGAYEGLEARVKGLPGVLQVQGNPGRLLIHLAWEGYSIHKILEEVEASGLKVLQVAFREPTLEETFLKITGKG